MSDLISRQDAIETIRKLPNAGMHWFVSAEAVFDVLLKLPSVQSEQRWIPVAERLPEDDDYKSCVEFLGCAVWYFTENGTMGLGRYYKSTKEWSTTDDLRTDGKVVAWMPLPEPYKEKET